MPLTETLFRIQKKPIPYPETTPRQTTRHSPDYLLFCITGLLTVIGFIAITSTATLDSDLNSLSGFGRRHAMMLIIGFVFLLIFQSLDYRHLARWSPLAVGLALLLLSLLFVPALGIEVNGARSWLNLPFLPIIQPSEFAKLAAIIYLAAWLTAKGNTIRSIETGIIPFVLIVGIILGLIIPQPDIGTAFILASIIGCMFFTANTTKIIHIFLLAISGTIVAGLLILSAPYRWQRILAFISSESDPQGIGYHTIQLANAFGSGGLIGQGLGLSRQKFYYLPAAKTDGIIAVIGEETGFVGSMIVILLLSALLWRGWLLVKNAPDMFGSLVATGICCWIAIQSGINIAGATNLIPLTGVPLPLISYGGSSLISVLTAIGILMSISRYTVHQKSNNLSEKRIIA